MRRNRNSTSTALGSNQTFTGEWEAAADASGMTIAIRSSSACTLFVDFSIDASNVDSTLEYDVDANSNDVHRLVITREYFRIRVVNSATAQTFLRMETRTNGFNLLSAPLNLSLQPDTDAIITRTFGEEFTIGESAASWISVVNKFGRNPDIDQGNTVEDVWNGGDVYSGFPTGDPAEIYVKSSSASDTGQLTFTYLASRTATEWQTATVTLNGTTPVATGITAIRVHTANYDSGSPTAFNLGELTVSFQEPSTVVFLKMPIGRSQSYAAVYTVPFGSIGVIRRIACEILGSATVTVEGALWVRELNKSPRLRRPLIAGTFAPHEERPYSGLRFPALTDIAGRILTCSANNTDVVFAFDILVIKQ